MFFHAALFSCKNQTVNYFYPEQVHKVDMYSCESTSDICGITYLSCLSCLITNCGGDKCINSSFLTTTFCTSKAQLDKSEEVIAYKMKLRIVE